MLGRKEGTFLLNVAFSVLFFFFFLFDSKWGWVVTAIGAIHWFWKLRRCIFTGQVQRKLPKVVIIEIKTFSACSDNTHFIPKHTSKCKA